MTAEVLYFAGSRDHKPGWLAALLPPPNALRGNIPAGEVDPVLPRLARSGKSCNSVREAIRIREAFTSYFSAEGTVPWQDNV
ncbi:unnamed protein product [Boreogadus saida]